MLVFGVVFVSPEDHVRMLEMKIRLGFKKMFSFLFFYHIQPVFLKDFSKSIFDRLENACCVYGWHFIEDYGNLAKLDFLGNRIGSTRNENNSLNDL